jgi:peptide/nickel transport system substrate-binding protein
VRSLVLVVALSLGCTHHGAPKKRLVIATSAEPDTLCPMLSTSGPAQEVMGLALRGLTREDASWTLGPDIAVSVPTLANGGAKLKDGKLVVAWQIRDDALWEDGVPVTAQDFILGWRIARDDSQGVVVGHDDAQRIESIAASADGKGFTETWSETEPTFAAPRVVRPLPSHVLGAMKLLKDDPICRKPLANGPFRLVEWVPGEHLLFARNEHFTPRPVLDEVLVKIFPTTMGIMTALQSGDVDAAFPSGGPSPTEAFDFAKAHPGFTVDKVDGPIWAHIDLNNDDPALKDVEVRRALAMAIPRAQIVSAVSGGLYVVAEGYLPPRHWGARKDLAPLPYDPAKARAILEPKHLHLTLSTGSGQRDAEQIVTLVQGALKDVGVDVAIDMRPFKVFFGEVVHKRKAQLAFYAWTLDDTTTGAQLFRADRIPSADNNWTGQNDPGWRNDEATKLLTDAERSLDDDARKKMLARAEDLFRDELPAIPMYFRPVVALRNERVMGFAPTGTLTPLAWNAATWDITPPPTPR